MRVEHFQNWFHAGVYAAGQSSPADRLVSMLNGKAEEQSPLGAARQALLDAKSRLEQQRDERIEEALEGYRALRSRQTSYESELGAQREQLEDFRALNDRYAGLMDELSAAKADYEACAASETTLDITRHNRLSLRVSSMENELTAVDQDITALVEQANRYGKAQGQYAAYLEQTDQNGYAAFQYRDQPEYTRENFQSETAGIIGRLEAGAVQWRDRVSSYCEQYSLTPGDFERYLQERRKLGDVCFAARQRFAELLYAADGADLDRQTKSVQRAAAPERGSLDTMEVSASARLYLQRTNPPAAAVDNAEADSISE